MREAVTDELDVRSEIGVETTPERATAPHQQLEEIASKLGLRLVSSRAELGRSDTSRSVGEALGSAMTDLGYLPRLSRIAAGYIATEVRRALGLNGKREKPATKNHPDTTTPILLVPGFLAPAEHLEGLKRRLNGQSRYSQTIKPSTARSVFDDAQALMREIMTIGPTRILADSRGGLAVLCALTMMARAGQADMVKDMILVSPPANGINSDLTGLGKATASIGLPAVRDMLPGSHAVTFWQNNLPPEIRRRIIVLSATHGDVFVGPQQSFVDGSQMLLANRTSHQQQVLDPKSPIFKAAIHLVENPIISSN